MQLLRAQLHAKQEQRRLKLAKREERRAARLAAKEEARKLVEEDARKDNLRLEAELALLGQNDSDSSGDGS